MYSFSMHKQAFGFLMFTQENSFFLTSCTSYHVTILIYTFMTEVLAILHIKQTWGMSTRKQTKNL